MTDLSTRAATAGISADGDAPARLAVLLRCRLTGSVTTRADDSWDAARAAWVSNVDQQPAAVVHPESADDVIATVEVASLLGYRVAAQGTGHNAGPLGDLSRTILVKTCRMRGIEVDPDRRVARVQAGVLWQELTEATARHGLAGLLGSSPDVGVVGYTLGGGLSWFGRKFGLCCDSVVAAEVVTADGVLRRLDAANEPDLLWALRGGGGNFGIVTALELALQPINEVHAGALFWPIERGTEIWRQWADWVDELPEEMTTWARFMRFPPFPDIPEPLRGQAFVIVEACHLGTAADADAAIGPLRRLAPVIDTFATIPTTMLSKVHMDPEQPVPAVGDGLMLADLPPEAVDALVAAAGADSGSALLSVEVRHLGGALARPSGGALGAFRGKFAVFSVGITPDAATEQVVREHSAAVRDALAPWDAGAGYLNFTERRVPPSYFFAPEAERRLAELKERFDSADRLHSNHPVR